MKKKSGLWALAALLTAAAAAAWIFLQGAQRTRGEKRAGAAERQDSQALRQAGRASDKEGGFFQGRGARLSRGQKLRRLKKEGLAASLQAEGMQEGALKLVSTKAQGKTLILNIWATWCAPCVEELPELAALAGKTSSKALVAAISTESAEAIQRFIEKAFPDLKGKIWTLSVPKERLLRVFPEDPIPSTYLFNQEGRLFQKEIGPRRWSQPRWTSLIQNPP